MRTHLLVAVLLSLVVPFAGCSPTSTARSSTSSTNEGTLDAVCSATAEQMRVPRSRINGKTSLGDLKADELDSVELVLALEQKFSIEIPDSAIPKLTGGTDWNTGRQKVTMEALAQLVDRLRGVGGGAKSN
jgi:acyl carrier protein